MQSYPLSVATLLYTILFLSVCSLLSSCTNYLHPKRELRAAWVATVVNIDWPSSDTLSVSEQKAEYVSLLDGLEELNLNAVIVQVRAAGDVFYPSKYEPWSRYLTGKEGTAPQPFYDPLKWMITETHKRGMEFHAWFNPYRATFNKDTLSLDSAHAFYQHRNWLVPYGNRFYFDPGLPKVQDYTTNLILEVVQQYEVDGVHFDDYFYPYKIKDNTFNDSLSFSKHAPSGIALEEWRRANVDSLVQKVSAGIEQKKPWVQFGISPFGVWRNKSDDPGGSDTRAGQTTYDDLYADPISWLEKKWIDYIVPQLYWSMDFPAASHKKLVDWWSDLDIDPLLFVGHGAYKVRSNHDKAWNKWNEIPKQINYSQQKENVTGSMFFSAQSLVGKHPKLNRKLKKGVYRYPAIPPAQPFPATINLPDLPAIVQSLMLQENKVEVVFSKEYLEKWKGAVLYRCTDQQCNVQKTENLTDIQYFSDAGNTNTLRFYYPNSKKSTAACITLIDRYGRESSPLQLDLN